jgi:hypothetical protein
MSMIINGLQAVHNTFLGPVYSLTRLHLLGSRSALSMDGFKFLPAPAKESEPVTFKKSL